MAVWKKKKKKPFYKGRIEFIHEHALLLSSLTWSQDLKETTELPIQQPKTHRIESQKIRGIKASNISPLLSSFSDMISFLWSIVILVTAESAVGNCANVFIVVVNYLDWARKEKICSADQILTALAVSRIGLLWVIVTDLFLTVFNPALQKSRGFFFYNWLGNNQSF